LFSFDLKSAAESLGVALFKEPVLLGHDVEVILVVALMVLVLLELVLDILDVLDVDFVISTFIVVIMVAAANEKTWLSSLQSQPPNP
jgi:hypothetical protein